MVWKGNSPFYSSPEPTPPAKIQKAFCSGCGKKIAKGHKFCPNCGAAAVAEVRPNQCACGAIFGPNDHYCALCGKNVRP